VSPPERYQFGPFEVDPSERECRRGNEEIPLTHKAFDLLLVLLRNAGRTIPKAELMTALWPDAAVEENNLAQAVFLLRKALGDDSERAVYIQTAPRVGYKFVAEVTLVDLPAASQAQPQSRVPSKYTAGIAAVSAMLIVAGVFLWQRMRSTSLTDQDVLVLADFTNTTGDAAFDGALRRALAFELEQSPFLKVMGDQEVSQILPLMGRPAGERITNDLAHEVCVREGQKATIGGSIISLGRTYPIALEAINCLTGATLAREQAEAEDKEHVLKAVAKAALGMRAKLGESLSSIQKTDRSRTKDEVTTNSLEALKAFQLGFELDAQGSAQEAIPHLRRAIEMDPNFASAYLFLGVAYGNLGQAPLQNESLTKAFALIDRVSERERLFISGEYYQYVAHDWNKLIDVARVLALSYPRFADGHHLLAASYSTRGEYQNALEQRQEAVRLEPRNLVFRANLMNAYLNVDRFDEAKAVPERAFAQKLDSPFLHQVLLNIAFMQDDEAGQAKEIQWFAGKPEETQSFGVQALNAMVHGQLRKAKALYQQAAELTRRTGNPSARPPNSALIDANGGNCEAARKEKLKSIFCMDEPALRLAEEEMAKNPPPNPDTTPLLYQRGLIALNSGKSAEAAGEFQKILDHKGRHWGPLYSITYLGLARAEAKTGDTAKAKRAYQDFLALWKDADKDLPFYMQGNKELAKLR
jgi:DNA-binding winged helix-turn-helix (wHTH) protein/Tfp pilus assembly protein PilF